jgi:hypothetical protein
MCGWIDNLTLWWQKFLFPFAFWSSKLPVPKRLMHEYFLCNSCLPISATCQIIAVLLLSLSQQHYDLYNWKSCSFKITGFSEKTLCNIVDRYGRFKGTCCFYTFALIYQATSPHILINHTFNTYLRENLKFGIKFLISNPLFHHCQVKAFFRELHFQIGTRGSVVVWDTILQAGRSQVRFPMKS